VGWPPTRYEAKALREGRQPRYWTFTVANATPRP
jgi:tRNA (guanine-N7-)-methyltransferase